MADLNVALTEPQVRALITAAAHLEYGFADDVAEPGEAVAIRNARDRLLDAHADWRDDRDRRRRQEART